MTTADSLSRLSRQWDGRCPSPSREQTESCHERDWRWPPDGARPGGPYTVAMALVGDELRRDTARAIARLSPEERVALALRLGEEDVSAYAAARGTTTSEARVAFRRSRRAGRTSSLSHDGDGP